LVGAIFYEEEVDYKKYYKKKNRLIIAE